MVRGARGLVAAVIVAVGVTIGGVAAADGSLNVDHPQYTPGQTVTFTGTGWEACEFQIAVNLATPEPDVVFIGLFDQLNGSFTGTLTAPTLLGTYVLDANGDQSGCVASVPFDVVQTLPTTTTTTFVPQQPPPVAATTTVSTTTTTTTVSTTVGTTAPTTTVAPTTTAPTTTQAGGVLPATGLDALWVVLGLAALVAGAAAALAVRPRSAR
jgi:hypothetical protein